ncbi:hypothetical protein ScoT_16180 [Streptomyces albidoflavus]|uniref:Uncharacterized protein n=1 Tax=Streptomyces albidoflavus TaxID=1886 RepID=A0AA37BWB9_9ACTN|nr:hypothetical protein ScoT_16180 [Streptomyces albidoflavus]
MANTQQDDTKPNTRDARRAAKAAKYPHRLRRGPRGAEAQFAHLGGEGRPHRPRLRRRRLGRRGGGAHGGGPRRHREAGVTVHDEFSGEFAAKVVTGPYEWCRMAGIQIGSPSHPRPGRSAA